LPDLKPGYNLIRMDPSRHCEERGDEAIQLASGKLDCFAEPVIGRAFARPVGSQ
jgi:hypothetical protein